MWLWRLCLKGMETRIKSGKSSLTSKFGYFLVLTRGIFIYFHDDLNTEGEIIGTRTATTIHIERLNLKKAIL